MLKRLCLRFPCITWLKTVQNNDNLTLTDALNMAGWSTQVEAVGSVRPNCQTLITRSRRWKTYLTSLLLLKKRIFTIDYDVGACYLFLLLLFCFYIVQIFWLLLLSSLSTYSICFQFYLERMTLISLISADVPLRICSLSQTLLSQTWHQ